VSGPLDKRGDRVNYNVYTIILKQKPFPKISVGRIINGLSCTRGAGPRIAISEYSSNIIEHSYTYRYRVP
jgi:hypothetical protein